MEERDMMAEYEEKRKASGDLRVPSNPDTYRPVVLLAPLTKTESRSGYPGGEADSGETEEVEE
jgi:hypothetical protein